MMNSLLVLPVIIPLGGALFLCMLRKRTTAVTAVSSLTAGFGLTVGVMLISLVVKQGPQAVSLGSWPAPYGIVFAADLFSAAMVLITWVIGLGIVIYSAADLKHKPSFAHYQVLIQFLLAGVNGTFLTADLFNLYVWFEVMLIASFGLMLLDAGSIQIQGGVKYVFLNLISTLTMLLAIGLLYGATGMLNFAELHHKTPVLSPGLINILAGLFLFSFSVNPVVA